MPRKLQWIEEQIASLDQSIHTWRLELKEDLQRLSFEKKRPQHLLAKYDWISECRFFIKDSRSSIASYKRERGEWIRWLGFTYALLFGSDALYHSKWFGFLRGEMPVGADEALAFFQEMIGPQQHAPPKLSLLCVLCITRC
jgi:hypothetical protein